MFCPIFYNNSEHTLGSNSSGSQGVYPERTSHVLGRLSNVSLHTLLPHRHSSRDGLQEPDSPEHPGRTSASTAAAAAAAAAATTTTTAATEPAADGSDGLCSDPGGLRQGRPGPGPGSGACPEELEVPERTGDKGC